MPISLGDVPWLVNEQLVLNNAVRRAAAATGARYIDTFTASAGHDACKPVGTRWLEPAVAPVNAFPVHTDRIVPFRQVQALAAALPDAALQRTDDGHLGHSAPARLASTLLGSP